MTSQNKFSLYGTFPSLPCKYGKLFNIYVPNAMTQINRNSKFKKLGIRFEVQMLLRF